jgi:predicted phosphodiesterase
MVVSPMRIHVLSDLHLERAPFTPPVVEADVVVLAGDVAQGTQGVTWAAATWPRTPVVYVAGNHEPYRHRWPSVVEEMRQAARGTQVHVLENQAVVLGCVRFLGCTLWTDFDAAGEETRAAMMRLGALLMNDYRHITRDQDGATLRPADTRDRHLASRAYLDAALSSPHDGPTVVVTHHAPHGGALPFWCRQPPLVAACLSRLESLMGAARVTLWVHGHTHWNVDRKVQGTRVVSNQRGYPRQRIPWWDPGKVVEV